VPLYAVLLYMNTERESVPGEREAHAEHADELDTEGQMVAVFALEDSDLSTSIRGDVVTDGPFLETKEVLAGLFVLDAADLDEALAVARRNPILRQGGGVEIRPVEGYGLWPRET
jgi:hypothetical protein